MLVEVTVPSLPHVGQRGDVVEVPDGQARVLILLKKVRAANATEQRATRRIYQRRDMVAEGSAPPTIAADVAPPVVAAVVQARRRGRPRRIAATERDE